MKVMNLASNLARRLGRRMKKKTIATAGAAIMAGGVMFAGQANAAPALLGWSQDNTTTPTEGPSEFFGFTFMDKEQWIATAGNQARDTFSRGSGNVMVADPDEYDDLGDIGDDQFNVFIQTPAIDISSDPSSATLSFDSSFRPYDTMTGLVDVSFDGGATFTNLLTLDTAGTPGGTSSLDRADEAVSLPLGAGGSETSAIVRFGMTDAGNDWWWAVDNVDVTTGGSSQFSEDFDSIMLSPFFSSSELANTGPAWANLPNAQTGTVIPEPSTLALVGLGAAAAVGVRRRDRK